MHKAIIIDDEQNGIDSLKLLVESYAKDISVVAETTDPSAAKALIEKFKPEIVFLDINMPNKSGFDVLEELDFKEFHLIITTAHKEYALRAIKNNALDYLLKPIDIDDLNKALYKIREKTLKEQEDISRRIQPEKLKTILKSFDLEHLRTSKISIHVHNKVIFLNIEVIIFISSEEQGTLFKTISGEKYHSSKQLSDFEFILDEHPFMIKVKKGSYININHISGYSKGATCILTMKDDTVIEIPRRKKTEILELLANKSKLIN